MYANKYRLCRALTNLARVASRRTLSWAIPYVPAYLIRNGFSYKGATPDDKCQKLQSNAI